MSVAFNRKLMLLKNDLMSVKFLDLELCHMVNTMMLLMFIFQKDKQTLMLMLNYVWIIGSDIENLDLRCVKIFSVRCTVTLNL